MVLEPLKRPHWLKTQVTLELALVSFLALFQELVLIRWLGQQIRVLAYFPNIILISAFLGIGVGCLLGAKRRFAPLWSLSLLGLALVTSEMSRIVFTQESLTEHLWLLYYDLPPTSLIIHDLYLPLILMFLLSGISFIPLGELLSERLRQCQAMRDPFWGYLWNIGASALGVAAFTLLCFLQASPVVWFSVLVLCGLGLAGARAERLVVLAAGVALLLTVRHADRAGLYSPYYAVTVERSPDSPSRSILVNGSLHQIAMPLKREEPRINDFARSAREGYHLPYRYLGRKPRRVLVLGAGTGNDVAVALDEGAQRVDAVEIDPVIFAQGREGHPDLPYLSPRVRRFNTDARSFLNASPDVYDLIVFGTLDSMTRLSALSNVRLDNFVYTVECFRAARRHLTSDGGVVLYFLVPKTFILDRLRGMVSSAFAEIPISITHHFNVFNSLLMAGPAFERLDGPRRRAVAAMLAKEEPAPVLPNDDWPYLYLETPALGGFYIKVGAAILLLAILSIGAAAASRGGTPISRGVDWEMLFFGIAFLLLETRGITAMNLLWGGTWLTNAVVMEAVFFTTLLGTLLTAGASVTYEAAILGILGSLGVVFFLPLERLFGMNQVCNFGISVLVVGLPVLFSALAFAAAFARRRDQGRALSWNLFGAVLGGLLEFLSMILGLRALIGLAAVCYLAAALAHRRAPADLLVDDSA